MTTKDEALALALQALKPRPGMPNPEYQSLMECAIEAIEEVQSRPEQEPVATLDDLEQEIYENTRQFVSRDVMEWMLKRYYTSPTDEQEIQLIAELAMVEASGSTDGVARLGLAGAEEVLTIFQAAHGSGGKK